MTGGEPTLATYRGSVIVYCRGILFIAICICRMRLKALCLKIKASIFECSA